MLSLNQQFTVSMISEPSNKSSTEYLLWLQHRETKVSIFIIAHNLCLLKAYITLKRKVVNQANVKYPFEISIHNPPKWPENEWLNISLRKSTNACKNLISQIIHYTINYNETKRASRSRTFHVLIMHCLSLPLSLSSSIDVVVRCVYV